MNDFIVKAVRSDDIYRKILNASMDKKDDIYRYEFMQQFEKKWEMYHCPLKAKQPGGYDVVMASGMLGYILPQKIGKKEEAYIDELAENFAVSIYGEENVGPWVSKTDEETLNEYIKPLMQSSLEVRGFEGITAYMYGDELAKMQNYIPAGMPYCAGYACGYYMVKYYLEKTGKNIIEATILPAEEILKEIDGFWEETTTF